VIWNEELDRHGAPPAPRMVARRDLMDTPDKVRLLLEMAGFGEPRVELIPWSHRPTPDEFVQRHVTLGATSRRLAGMSEKARSAFVDEARSRLDELSPVDFEDRSEVIGATAIAV
jgi:hypothetical protein